MSQAYLITFIPQGPFYLGSSQSWDESFHAVSRKHPTPMTLLGCLRFNLLKKCGLLAKSPISGRFYPDMENHESAIHTLTGSSPAIDLHTSTDANLGIIEQLSPIFLVKQAQGSVEDLLYPSPADVIWEDSKKQALSRICLSTDSMGKSFSGNAQRNVAFHSNYSPKTESLSYWGNREFWVDYLEGNSRLRFDPKLLESEVFLSESQVGIARDDDRKAIEGAFYRKDHFRLNPEYAFGAIVHVSETKTSFGELLPDQGLVQLGGEQSKFWLQVKELNSLPDPLCLEHPILRTFASEEQETIEITESDEPKKIVALSPLLDRSLFDSLDFAIIPDIEAVRMLGGQGRKRKTDTELMIPAGSVFYPSSGLKFKPTGQLASKIGYNRLITARR